jgi:hypothetical protein
MTKRIQKLFVSVAALAALAVGRPDECRFGYVGYVG